MIKNVGPVQARVLGRALRSSAGYVIPAGMLERRALRRLEARGYVRRLGLLDTWKLAIPTAQMDPMS